MKVWNWGGGGGKKIPIIFNSWLWWTQHKQQKPRSWKRDDKKIHVASYSRRVWGWGMMYHVWLGCNPLFLPASRWHKPRPSPENPLVCLLMGRAAQYCTFCALIVPSCSMDISPVLLPISAPGSRAVSGFRRLLFSCSGPINKFTTSRRALPPVVTAIYEQWPDLQTFEKKR
jgi:hypothetical protein